MAKSAEIKGCGTTFMRLGAFGDRRREGVCPNRKTKIRVFDLK